MYKAAIAAFVMLGAASAGAETLEIGTGQAVRIEGGRGVGQVVIGDPMIADVSVDGGGGMMVFGKQVGATSLTLLDRSGRVLRDDVVVVRSGGAATVTVTYGAGQGVKPGGLSVVHACAEGCSKVVAETGGPSAPAAAPVAAAPTAGTGSGGAGQKP